MSVQVAKIREIPIRLHFTLVITIALISFTLASNFMPLYFPSLSLAEYWIIGIIGALILFLSVLIHEIAHSILAQRYGVKVREIILFVFGGVSDISEELKDYRKDLKMAAAGPVTSFILAGMFALAWWLLSSMSPNDNLAVRHIVIPVLYYGAFLNVVLGGFNLVPAFPSDGGRILRAFMVKMKKDYNQATKIAVGIGVGISYGFMAIGFLILLSGSIIGGIWLLLLGWFLKSGAESYLAQTQLEKLLSRVYLRDIMNTNIISVRPYFTGSELLQNYFYKYMKSAFPVVDSEKRLIGLVTLSRLLAVPEKNLAIIKAEEIMIPLNELIIMDANKSAENALTQITRMRSGKIFICDKDGRLIGMITKTDILNVEIEGQEVSKVTGNSTSGKNASANMTKTYQELQSEGSNI